MLLTQKLEKVIEGKKLLIFDFDGTIADTTKFHEIAFCETLSRFGLTVSYPRIAGMRTTEALAECFKLANLPIPSSEILLELVYKKQEVVRKLINKNLGPMPLVDKFLRWAYSRYRLALVTSGSKTTVQTALKKLGYEGLFTTQLYAEDVQRGKPDPEGFKLALKIQCCVPSQALIFEDSVMGFQAANEAKIPYIDITDRSYGLHLPGRAS